MDPSPEQQHIQRLKEIFQAAADRSYGESQPKFERLSKSFNAMCDAADAIYDTASIRRFALAKSEFERATQDLQEYCRTDHLAASNYTRMAQEIMELQKEEDEAKKDAPPPSAPPPSVPPKKKPPRHIKL